MLQLGHQPEANMDHTRNDGLYLARQEILMLAHQTYRKS